jgi:hypothetical protein
MRRGFVFYRILGRTVDLHKNKSRRIIRLLEDIKPDNTGFKDTVPSVFQADRFKGLNEFRLNMNMNMNDVHGMTSSV